MVSNNNNDQQLREEEASFFLSFFLFLFVFGRRKTLFCGSRTLGKEEALCVPLLSSFVWMDCSRSDARREKKSARATEKTMILLMARGLDGGILGWRCSRPRLPPLWAVVVSGSCIALFCLCAREKSGVIPNAKGQYSLVAKKRERKRPFLFFSNRRQTTDKEEDSKTVLTICDFLSLSLPS